MPELPEVETTVRALRSTIVGRKFVGTWADWGKAFEVLTPTGELKYKRTKGFEAFKKALIGRKILGLERRAKFVVFRLSGSATLLVHMKLTGHLLVGKWRQKGKRWEAVGSNPALKERWNGYLRFVATFDNGQMLAFSDLRRFGRLRLVFKALKLEGSTTGVKELDELGPEPLGRHFNFAEFRDRMKQRRVAIKTVLLDQKVVAGLGNIYTDEVLWQVKVYPGKRADKLTLAETKAIFEAIPDVLTEGIKRRGTTIADYRMPDGNSGSYQTVRHAYQRHNQPCHRCGTLLKRLKINGRSSHYCPKCQKDMPTCFSRGLFLNITSADKNKWQEDIQFIKQLKGVEHIEIWLEYTHASKKDLTWLKEQLTGYKLIFHAPFINLSLVSHHPEINEASNKVLKNVLDWAIYLEAEVVTVHAGSYPLFWSEGDARRVFIKNYQGLIEYAQGRLIIAVENISLSRTTQISYPVLLSELATLKKEASGIKFTLDVGHCIQNGQNDYLSFLLANADAIVNIHLHNALMSGRGHFGLQKTGDLNAELFLNALITAGYSGFLSLEILDKEDIARSWKIIMSIGGKEI